MAKSIMFQGTSSNVGKSVLAAAFCRIFMQDGYKVAPFKAQNMALNSYVTKDGGEMGRAQVVQAEAAGVEPDVRMNPVLLKPTGNAASQVIVKGKAIGNYSAFKYHKDLNMSAVDAIEECYDWLADNHSIVVLEGAGSPAEVNLKDRDIVNMRMAKYASAPVILVADIDRGGALAAVVGTLELLDNWERQMIKGIIINKFRGDVKLLEPALDFLEEKTGIPVLGVVPYISDIQVPEEDSVCLQRENLNKSTNKRDDFLQVAVIGLPKLSNFTDFDCFALEPDVQLQYIRTREELGDPDLCIIPGSKNSIEDMKFLEKSGLADAIRGFTNSGGFVWGICGGYQMLGCKLTDAIGAEGKRGNIDGLNLLDISTVFAPEKTTCQVKGELMDDSGAALLSGCQGMNIEGYEIHMGNTSSVGNGAAVVKITERSGKSVEIKDGAVNAQGNVVGTYIHGIFDNDQLRHKVLNNLRQQKGWKPLNTRPISKVNQEKAYENLAKHVRSSVQLKKLYEIMEQK
ncbi:adenosylcobyric acid synthase [Desulfitispora alkaliphila]